MTTVKSWKASRLREGSPEPPRLILSFEQEVPDLWRGDHPEYSARNSYAAEAARIVAAMAAHLPGGLFDAMFAEMARRQASVLRVAHDPGGSATGDRPFGCDGTGYSSGCGCGDAWETCPWSLPEKESELAARKRDR